MSWFTRLQPSPIRTADDLSNDEPITPYYMIRAIPGFYLNQDLPEGLTEKEAVKFVSERAQGCHLKMCLVWSRRWAIYFNEEGEITRRAESKPGESNVPTMQIGTETFVVDGSGGGLKPRILDYP